MVNDTRTTLWEELWRWGRAITRALLLMGALAGMTLGAVAHAQVAFRSASSVTQPIPTFRAASSATQVASPAPNFQAAGGQVSGTGAVTPAWPAHEINDVALLFVESAGGQAATLSTPAGFVAVANSPQATGAGAAGTRITVFWARATSTAMASPTVADPGDHVYARILTYRGVFASGNPWDVTGGGVKAAASGTVTVTGVTTTVANTLIVQAVARDNDNAGAAFSAQTNGNLTGIAERSDAGTTQGNGGGIGVWDGVKATAGGTGNTTANVTNSINAFLTIALRPATSALTITRPAGTLANDVMVASMGFRTNQPGLSTDVTITPPAGWTLVRRNDNAGPTDSGLAVYQRVAGGAEPANYTWRFTCIATCATNGFSAAAGGIVGFSNVNTTTPVDVENAQNTPAAASHFTSDVTTTVANAMLVTAHSVPNANTWQNPPPSGMTQGFQVRSGAETIQASWALQAAAGATGQKQATDLGPDAADVGNAHILALRPALRSSITINKPAGTIQNDVMIASIGFSPNTLTITTPPAGWMLVRRVDNTNANANSLAVYRLTAGAAEPASYTWTFSAAGYLAGGILTFSGVDTTTPIDVENGNCTQQGSCATTTLSHATPIVTTTVTNTMLVTSHTYSSAGTWTSPGAMTEAVDVQHGNQSLGINYVLQAAAGATGAKTATASTQADVGNAHILALRPVPPPPPAAGGFNAYETSTAAGAITGVIRTKIAGATMSLDMIALNTAKTAIETTFTGTVRVEVLNASDNSGALDGNSCRPTWTVIQTLSPDPAFIAGDNGRKTISFTQANSYPNARLRITFPAGAPTVTGCSTDNFAIRPNTLASFAVTDTDWQTAGTGRALTEVIFGTVTHKAGRPLSVRATALNAAGVPATTTNYVGAPTAALAACVGAACTATFGTLTLTTTFLAGQLASDVAFYNNVGSFALRLEDQTFASVDTADTNGDCTVAGRYVCSATINVGRFVPDHFAVTLNTPVFGPACGPFTYIGQAFNYTTAPVITVTAQDFANTTTTLYNTIGSWFRIINASLTGKSYTAATGTLDVSSLPGTDPVIVSSSLGVGTLTFGSGTGLFFTRTTPTAPASPYDADISLAIDVIDADGVAYATNPARFGTATAGNGIAFSDGNALTTNDKQMRFGRLRLTNAFGSALLDLPLSLSTQYYDGNFFVTNTLDSCTMLAASDVRFVFVAGTNLTACETHLNPAGAIAFASGQAAARLTKPGSTNDGAVDLTVNLGAVASGNTCTSATSSAATAANKTWLQGDWGSGAYTDNPRGRATFGLYKGADEFIYLREVY